mmetsp:Transcript_16189/g.44553  ORF Transcript_16189/g.44553 Transcript_16189/m.44553 type:complete len:205 (+) Transcript_16189:3224-3838(+)
MRPPCCRAGTSTSSSQWRRLWPATRRGTPRHSLLRRPTKTKSGPTSLRQAARWPTSPHRRSRPARRIRQPLVPTAHLSVPWRMRVRALAHRPSASRPVPLARATPRWPQTSPARPRRRTRRPARPTPRRCPRMWARRRRRTTSLSARHTPQGAPPTRPPPPVPRSAAARPQPRARPRARAAPPMRRGAATAAGATAAPARRQSA